MNILNMKRRPLTTAVALAVAFSLSACGGGGSNVQPTQSPAPAPAPSPSPSSQPPIDAQLSLTDTYVARSAGYTGKGITIGIVDTGVMRTNAALAPRVIKNLVYVSSSTNNTTVDDANGHGTWVAEIAAGVSFDKFAGGIAPGADIVSARILDDNNSSTTGGLTYTQETSELSKVSTDLINNGVKVMNNSWGGLTWSDPSLGVQLATAYQNFVDNWGGLVVFAAGNDNGAALKEGDIAALPQDASYLLPGWIVAVALDSNHPTQLASYSDQCGVTMNYCISAPGDVIVLDKDTVKSTISPTYWVVSGTSIAAPEVSGAAALVWQAFPYFSNDLVRQTILGTATDLGAPGVDPLFGWGALDVGKAVKGPANFAWGNVSVSFDNYSSQWGNDITGAGGLNKSGTGTLVLFGKNSYQGDTNVLGGTLQSRFAIPGNANVSSGAWLTGMYASGSLRVGLPGVNGNLDNSGNVLVAAGNANITGNYTQTSSGTLVIALGSVLDVSGTASIDGTLNIAGSDINYVTTSHQDLLTAAGGLTGTFSNFTTASGVFLSSTPQYDANDVWIDTTSLSVTGALTVAGYSASPLVMNSAQRVDGAFQQINHSLATSTSGKAVMIPQGFVLGAAAIQHTPTFSAAAISMRSLSGQLHAASAAMALEGIDATHEALGKRLDTLGEFGHYGVWARDLRLSGDMAQRGMSGVGFQLDGWMFGADRALGSAGYIGYALSQSRGDTRLDRSLDRNRSRSSETLAYAGWRRGRWYTRGQFGFGQYRQDVSRRLLLGYRWVPVSTWYDGSYRTAHGESGLHFGHGANTLTPYMDVDYTRLDRNGFAEQGAFGFGLQAPAQTLSRLRAGAGLRASHRVNLGSDRWVDLSAHAQWQHTLAARGEVFDASFVGVNDWRPLVGVGLSPSIRQVGVGMDAQLGRASTLNFGYDYATGRHVHTTQVMLRYSLAF